MPVLYEKVGGSKCSQMGYDGNVAMKSGLQTSFFFFTLTSEI